MIHEWEEIEKYKAQMLSYLIRGGELPGKEDDHEEYVEVHPDAF